MRQAPCVISVADHTGWAHLLCVGAQDRVPAVITRRRVALIDPGLPTQPYEHDSVAMREDDANALITRVERSAAACATVAVQRIVTELAATAPVVALAIRQPPLPRRPRSIADVRASYRLQCAADGMLYQDAICRAARRLGLDVQLCPRGDEIEQAAQSLGVTSAEIEEFVVLTGRPAGPPWTEEHRRAYAAGIAALAPHVRTRLRLRSSRSARSAGRR